MRRCHCLFWPMLTIKALDQTPVFVYAGVCVIVCSWPLRVECRGRHPRLPLVERRSWRPVAAPSCWS